MADIDSVFDAWWKINEKFLPIGNLSQEKRAIARGFYRICFRNGAEYARGNFLPSATAEFERQKKLECDGSDLNGKGKINFEK